MSKQKQTERDPKIELAIAQTMSYHKGKRLFIDPAVESDLSIQRLELGLPTLNKILSNKYCGEGSGLPKGKILNFYGPESIGKTAMAAQIAGEVLANGGKILWIDAEFSFDPEYMALAYGVDITDTQNVVVENCDNAEEAFDTIQAFVEVGAVDLIVLDSVSALGTVSQNEKNAEKASMAEVARKLAEHFPKIIGKLKESGTSIIYINQLRENITQMGAFGKKFTGGNAMRFYPHIALEFKKPQNNEIKRGSGDTAEFIGQEVFVKAKKNKTARPQLWGYFTLYPGEGFSRVIDVVKLAEQTGVIKRAGAWFKFDNISLAQGIDNLKTKLEEDEDLLNKIWEKTNKALHPVVDYTTGEILDEEPTD